MTYARAYYHAPGQPISNDIVTQLIIDTVGGDPEGFFSPSKLGFVIPGGRGGMYVVMVTGYWDASPNDGGTLRQVEIRSGNSPIGGDTKSAVRGMPTWVSAVASAVFNVGDVITVHARQTSGATLQFKQVALLLFAP